VAAQRRTDPGTGSNGHNVAWHKVMPRDSCGGRSDVIAQVWPAGTMPGWV
jgi:hypothetical protein